MFEYLDYDSLSDIDLSIIKYILNNPELASLMRVRDLAQAVHVSPSTIMRFLEHVGYDSFMALRVDIKNKLIIDEELATAKNLTHINYNEQLKFGNNFEDSMDELAHRIANANITYIMGLGSSGIMAEYAHRILNSIGYNSYISKDGHLPILWNKDLFDENNVLLILSTSGETKEILKTLQHLPKARPFIVSITNHDQNSLSNISDLNIPYYIAKDRLSFHIDLTSQIPVVHIIETLVKVLHQYRLTTNETPFE